MQQGPAGPGGEEGERLSTRRASPREERTTQRREVVENQLWVGSPLDTESSAYGCASLSTPCFLMDMEQLLLKAPHAKGLCTGHTQASTDGKYRTSDIKGAGKYDAVLLSPVDRNSERRAARACAGRALWLEEATTKAGPDPPTKPETQSAI